MIIVLEGADGTGKTTLANMLIKETGARYLHLTYRWPEMMPLYHVAALDKALEWLRQDPTTPVILDRWWMSEAVYANVFRGGTRWPQLGRILDRVMLTVGGVYVTCLGDKDHAARFERLKGERKELFGNVSRVDEVYRAYCHKDLSPAWADNYLSRALGTGTFIRHYEYIFTAPGNHVNNIMGRLGALVRPWYDCIHGFHPGPLYGSPSADVVFVGDRVNLKGLRKRPCFPFFSLDECSGYLNKMLQAHTPGLARTFDEGHAAWCNVNDEGGHLALRRFCRPLERSVRLVALGAEAERGIRACGLGHLIYARWPHPQAARRFPKYHREFKQGLENFINEEYLKW